MEIEKDIAYQTPIIKAIQKKEINLLIKYIYNIAITFLINKYEFIELLPDKTSSIEDVAIKISSSFFNEDETGETQFIPVYEKMINNSLNSSDIEFYLLNIIQQRIDHEIGIIRKELLAK